MRSGEFALTIANFVRQTASTFIIKGYQFRPAGLAAELLKHSLAGRITDHQGWGSILQEVRQFFSGVGSVQWVEHQPRAQHT